MPLQIENTDKHAAHIFTTYVPNVLTDFQFSILQQHFAQYRVEILIDELDNILSTVEGIDAQTDKIAIIKLIVDKLNELRKQQGYVYLDSRIAN